MDLECRDCSCEVGHNVHAPTCIKAAGMHQVEVPFSRMVTGDTSVAWLAARHQFSLAQGKCLLSISRKEWGSPRSYLTLVSSCTLAQVLDFGRGRGGHCGHFAFLGESKQAICRSSWCNISSCRTRFGRPSFQSSNGAVHNFWLNGCQGFPTGLVGYC